MKYRKKLMAVSGVISLVMGMTPMFAWSKSRPTWSMPSGAVQVDDNVFYLGQKTDPKTHQLVEGYAFIHRANNVKNSQAAKKGGPSACYAYIASGAKWKINEPWVMNTANTRGLDETTVFNLEKNGIAKWENATDGNVNNTAGADVMGIGTTTTVDLSAGAGTLNNANEVYFASISGSSSIIAVTNVWGIWSGPTQNREIVEWDQVYDDSDFDWSAGEFGEIGKMDFDNIATHEIGHAFGMGHPSSTCTQETMYAYAGNGETIKRNLNTGDINGINLLY